MLACDKLDSCSDVFTWLNAAATLRGGGGLQNVVPGVYHPLAPVHLPADVYQYMIGKVRSDLPALLAAADPTTAAETWGVLAGALRPLAGKAAGGEAGKRTGKEPKTVAEVYKEETYETLFVSTTLLGDVTELAPLLGRLANCLKGEQPTVMTQEFKQVCLAQGLTAEFYAPIVTNYYLAEANDQRLPIRWTRH